MFARLSPLVVAVVCALPAAPLAAADWGSLTGRFVFDGAPPAPTKITPDKDTEVCSKHPLVDESLVVGADGSVANVVIYVRTKNPAVAPGYAKDATAKVVLDNKNCRFEPHVTVLRTSQSLEVKNSDPVGHNSKFDPLKNPGSNVLIPSNSSADQKMTEEENLPVKVSCNIHPWMGAWVVVRNDPYAAASDKEGKFAIKDLPAGTELEFQLWQEKSGYLKNVAGKGVKADTKGRFKMTIKPGENDLGEIKLPAALFNK